MLCLLKCYQQNTCGELEDWRLHSPISCFQSLDFLTNIFFFPVAMSCLLYLIANPFCIFVLFKTPSFFTAKLVFHCRRLCNSESSIFMSRPSIKWTPSTKQALNQVPKLTSYISFNDKPLFSRHWIYQAEADTKILYLANFYC